MLAITKHLKEDTEKQLREHIAGIAQNYIRMGISELQALRLLKEYIGENAAKNAVMQMDCWIKFAELEGKMKYDSL